eukprot:2941936-Amphidinium_carterae.1
MSVLEVKPKTLICTNSCVGTYSGYAFNIRNLRIYISAEGFTSSKAHYSVTSAFCSARLEAARKLGCQCAHGRRQR